MYGFDQLTVDPASSYSTDLMFIDQSNLVVDSGVHPSLHITCHHQITSA